MKIKNPEMMTPGWWLKNHALQFRYATAEGCMDSCKYHFEVEITEDGNVLTANHGSVIINSTGDRQVDWRDTAERTFGVVCDLASNLAGKLFCPKTKKSIPVSRIKNNPVLWCDKEYGVAMFPMGLTYHEPDGPPVAAEHPKIRQPVIEYSFANQKATTAFVERFHKICLEAKLRCSLLEIALPNFAKGDVEFDMLRSVHRNDTFSLEELALPSLHSMIPTLAYMADRIPKHEDFIKLMCADHYASTYLEYRP